MESLDAEFHKSLLWIKDADSSDLAALDLTFSVDEEVCHLQCPYYLFLCYHRNFIDIIY